MNLLPLRGSAFWNIVARAPRMNIAMFLPINDEAITFSTEYSTSGLLHPTGDTLDKSDLAASSKSSLEGVISSSSNTLWDCPSFPDGTHPWLENDTYTREYEHLDEPLSCTDTYLDSFLSISQFSEPATLDFSRSDQSAVERSILPAPASFQWETFLSPDAVLPSLPLPSPVPISEFLSAATTITPGYLSYQNSIGNRHESSAINTFCAPRSITSPGLYVPKPISDVRKQIFCFLLYMILLNYEFDWFRLLAKKSLVGVKMITTAFPLQKILCFLRIIINAKVLNSYPVESSLREMQHNSPFNLAC